MKLFQEQFYYFKMNPIEGSSTEDKLEHIQAQLEELIDLVLGLYDDTEDDPDYEARPLKKRKVMFGYCSKKGKEKI